MKKIIVTTLLILTLSSVYILVSKSAQPNPHISKSDINKFQILPSSTNPTKTQMENQEQLVDPNLAALPSDWTKHDDNYAEYYDTYISPEYRVTELGGGNTEIVKIVTMGGNLKVRTSDINNRLNDPVVFRDFATSCKLSSVINCEEIEIGGILTFRSEHRLGPNQEKSYTYLQTVHNSTLYDFTFTFADSFETDKKNLIIDNFIESYEFKD